MSRLLFPLLLSACVAAQTPAGSAPPRSWIDKDTGHRIVRLTDEPDSASLYFNQNGYTADGRKLIYTTPEGISALDLAARTAKSVVKGRVRVIVTGRKSQKVYYTKDGAVFSADVDTGETREIAKLPPRGSITTVNADETLLAGTYIEGQGADYNPNRPAQPQQLDQPRNKGEMMEQRLAARLPMALFLVDTRTGATRVLHRATDWLNHLEFSPTDPSLLMFCHEGPWHKVDRIWTIRTDGSQLTKIHTRTMAMEIFGHEFWSPDGKVIWYDLQTPRGEDFWLAGYEIADRPANLVSPAAQRVVDPLQCHTGWQALLRRWRRSGPGGQGSGRPVDLPVPRGTTGEPGLRRQVVRPAGRTPSREARQHVETPVPAGAQRQLHTRREVGGFPFEYVRPHLHVRRGSRQSGARSEVA
ncbi:MAG: oligogalacturonate lyase family protein [Paludibaculum sp.]